jgi:hypothetical protein
MEDYSPRNQPSSLLDRTISSIRIGTSTSQSAVARLFFSNHNFTYSADLSFTPSPDRRSLGYSPDLAAVPSWASFSANNSYAPMLESSLLSRGILHDRSLFSGLLSCPASKNTTAGAGDCVKALADPNPDPDPDDGINEQFRKRDDPVHRCRSLPSCTAKVKSDYRCSG